MHNFFESKSQFYFFENQNKVFENKLLLFLFYFWPKLSHAAHSSPVGPTCCYHSIGLWPSVSQHPASALAGYRFLYAKA
jgi:hypothetical protein